MIRFLQMASVSSSQSFTCMDSFSGKYQQHMVVSKIIKKSNINFFNKRYQFFWWFQDRLPVFADGLELRDIITCSLHELMTCLVIWWCHVLIQLLELLVCEFSHNCHWFDGVQIVSFTPFDCLERVEMFIWKRQWYNTVKLTHRGLPLFDCMQVLKHKLFWIRFSEPVQDMLKGFYLSYEVGVEQCSGPSSPPSF